MNVNGITWVGNTFEKFEAMCLEVEEAMYKDTVRYVESQVHNVGARVKKLYSDVMQDFLPQFSLDPAKISVHDLYQEKYSDEKPKVRRKGAGIVDSDQFSGDLLCNNKDEFCRYSCGDNVKKEHSNLNSRRRQYCYKSKSTSSNFGVEEIFNKDRLPPKAISVSSKALCDFFNENHEASSDQTVTSTTASSREGKRFYHKAGSCKPSESTCEGRALISDEYPSFDMLNSVKSVQNEGQEMRASSSGSLSAESNEESNELSSDATCTNINGLEQTDNEKIEETCVMVNEDDLEFPTCKEVKSRTYKKKILGTFTLRRKSARKQEYEQLVAWFGNEAKPNQQFGKALMPTNLVQTHKLPNHESCGSEWELL